MRPFHAHAAMTDLRSAVSQHLVDPASHRAVKVQDQSVVTGDGRVAGTLKGDVAVMMPTLPASYFDDRFATMLSGHDEKGGEWKFAYAQQVALVESILQPGSVTIDVGCGPGLPYAKPAGATVIGLEYSLPSIAANPQVDLKVCASATAMPFASASVDTIICFYSVHHMVRDTRAATEDQVRQAMAEFARVVKPGGQVLIFEMAPLGVVGWLELRFWNLAKRLLGNRLDQFFWPVQALRAVAAQTAPDAELEVRTFSSPAWTTFPPFFSLPWFRLPRFLYPLHPVCYVWRKR